MTQPPLFDLHNPTPVSDYADWRAKVSEPPPPPSSRPVYFDGETYEPDKDEFRLCTELQRVWMLMLNGKWWTLAGLSRLSGASEASVSARIRDFRKERFGSHEVDRRRVDDSGLHEYRLRPQGRLIIGWEDEDDG